MRRMSAIGLVCFSALWMATAAAAQPPAQTTYTFVAQWDVPRAQWESFAADFEKTTRPVLEKLASSGAIVGWGVFEHIVHTPDGFTHGTWWSSTSEAGIEQARNELRKTTSAAIMAATNHRDFYLRSALGNAKSGSGAGGYLRVSSTLVKPGQGQEWQQLFEKNVKGIFDELLANGTFVFYGIDVEDTHTDNPGWRHLVTLAPNIDAEVKAGAAFEAANAKRTPEERKAMAAANQALVEPGAHRDMYARVLRYWIK
jgi:hypothetical protein